MRVPIALCLCPRRHPILVTGIDTEATGDDARVKLVALQNQLGLSECQVCGATFETWLYERSWSREFADAAEAQTVLEDEGLRLALLADRRQQREKR